MGFIPNVLNINSQKDVITEEIVRNLNKALIFRFFKIMAMPMYLGNTTNLKIALFEGGDDLSLCV